MHWIALEKSQLFLNQPAKIIPQMIGVTPYITFKSSYYPLTLSNTLFILTVAIDWHYISPCNINDETETSQKLRINQQSYFSLLWQLLDLNSIGNTS